MPKKHSEVNVNSDIVGSLGTFGLTVTKPSQKYFSPSQKRNSTNELGVGQ